MDLDGCWYSHTIYVASFRSLIRLNSKRKPWVGLTMAAPSGIVLLLIFYIAQELQSQPTWVVIRSSSENLSSRCTATFWRCHLWSLSTRDATGLCWLGRVTLCSRKADVGQRSQTMIMRWGSDLGLICNNDHSWHDCDLAWFFLAVWSCGGQQYRWLG
jgi:hypothetical protein